MAILGTITKQSNEKLDFDVAYDTVLAGRSDTIVATPTVSVSPSGVTIVSSVLTGNKLKVVFASGTNSTAYKVTIDATSTAGLIYEDEVNIMIVDI